MCNFEGCYLYYDTEKEKFIRIGFASGDGCKSYFEGRGKRHLNNATKMEQMRHLRFYRQYPLQEAKDNYGAPSGYFENLVMYCGMAFDKKQVTRPLY